MRTLIAVVLFATPLSAFAEEVGVDAGVPSDIKEEQVLAAKLDAKQGFHPKLSIGATGAYNHSSQVVGTTDGSTIQLGLMLDGQANLYRGQHEWENQLKVRESTTRTPQVPTFVKSADELELKSTYLFRLESITWLGPYGRAQASTQLFHGYEVRAEDVTIRRALANGDVVEKSKPAGSAIALTTPFEPVFLRESLGLFANPLNDKTLTAKVKLGAGVQHIFTRGGFTLTDDAATPTIEYTELRTSHQAGGELDLGLNGALADNVTWEASAQYFFPLYTSLEDAPTGLDVLTHEYAAKLSLKLTAALSLDYVLSAKRVPLVIEAWQVQNGLMLKAGYDLL